MRHKQGTNRQQIQIMQSLDEMVEKDSIARQIDEFVDKADTSYFEKAKAKATGRPPYGRKGGYFENKAQGDGGAVLFDVPYY